MCTESHVITHCLDHQRSGPHLACIQFTPLSTIWVQYHAGQATTPQKPRQCVQYLKSTQPASKNNHTCLKQNSLGLRKLNLELILDFTRKLSLKSEKKLIWSLLFIIPEKLKIIFFFWEKSTSSIKTFKLLTWISDIVRSIRICSYQKIFFDFFSKKLTNWTL